MKSPFLFVPRHLERFTKLGPAGILGLFWMSAPGIAGIYLLYQLGPVSRWLEAQGEAGILIYAIIFMISSGLGLLPTTGQAVLGGWVFGVWPGVLAASTAFGGAAALGYLITRSVAGERVRQLIDTKPEARAIRAALIGKGFFRTAGMVALLRLPPQSPFAFTNLVMVSCGVPALPFILGTMLGLFPRTLLVAGLAAAAARTGAEDIQSFVKEGPGWFAAAVGIAAVAVVMAVIGLIARRALASLKVDPASLRS